MHARLTMIAAVLTLASAAAAEPAKKPAGDAAQPLARPPVMLASADQSVGKAPAPVEATAVPQKRPRGVRLTSCRCGDPQPAEQER